MELGKKEQRMKEHVFIFKTNVGSWLLAMGANSPCQVSLEAPAACTWAECNFQLTLFCWWPSGLSVLRDTRPPLRRKALGLPELVPAPLSPSETVQGLVFQTCSQVDHHPEK